MKKGRNQEIRKKTINSIKRNEITRKKITLAKKKKINK